MPARPHNDLAASASSSSHSPAAHTPTSVDDRDELDFLGDDPIDDGQDRDDDVLEDDPLGGELGGPVSFKRKQNSSLLSSTGRILSNLAGGSGSQPSSSDRPGSGDKDNAPLDWYMEGPGRRVGYEDLTAIDWIFEYNKERLRLRGLASGAGGLVGYLINFLDSSQIWVVVVLTGLAVGAVAACIDIASDWLSDLKEGYCTTGPDGGTFYLSKPFCCYGHDYLSDCAGWRSWGATFGLAGGAGSWIVGYVFYTILAVTFAVLASVLVQDYSIWARHSGIPEIKTVLGGFVIRRLLGPWTLITKSLGLVLACASGMWLGKEGPLVHVACCCANLFIKFFPSLNGNEARKREVLSAAAASGISVAFGSPIGGVLFSLETLSYYFPDKTMWQSFVCAMTAAVCLQAFDPFRSGKLVLYQAKYSVDWTDFEIIPYAILGIFGGIYGGLFIRLNMAVARWKKSTSWLPGPVLQVLVVALISALINYPNFYLKVQTSELVSNLFRECSKIRDDPVGLCNTGAASLSTIFLLFAAALLAFFLAAITFGLQIPAGIILPSMAVGALVGRAVGILMEMWYNSNKSFYLFKSCPPDTRCVIPGTYAIVGAAAALAGVTRLTVSIVVIVFELTGALTYVLPIMVAVVISKWIGDAFSRRGIYESWIHLKEYPFLDNTEEMPLPDIATSQIMTRIEELVVLTATGHTISSLESILEMHPYRGFPIISDPREATLLGYISRTELAYNLRAATQEPRFLPPDAEAYFSHQPLADPRTTLDLRPWMDHTPITLPSRTALHLVVTYFQRLGLRYVLFSERGALQGLLTKKDVWYVLNGAEESRHNAQHGGPGHHADGSVLEERGLLRAFADEPITPMRESML
ncbi:unnamed protein product [Clonostachys byssicola]|uniref:Chloride channel protein n=1 Tax=Clonostachys byssicola TaxID=160290 RepID=A0A9N9UMS3_9HYPO|nr:unnamed protein product [Clonostachys byssicola]